MTQNLYDVVIFHRNCSDGTCGYWVARKYLQEKNHLFHAIAMHAGENLTIPNSTIENKRILYIDVCPSFEFLQELSKVAKDIMILDHHTSTFITMESMKNSDMMNVKYELDIKLSGCQLAWNHFYPDLLRPWFLEYISDRDLWKFELGNSKEINEALHYKNLINVESMDMIICYTMDEIQTLVDLGKIILDITNKTIHYALRECVEGIFLVDEKIYNVWFGTIGRNLRSEFGNQMIQKRMMNGNLPDFSVVYSYQPKLGLWFISLRGSENCPDLSIIAKHFGGGGHKKAAGFEYKNPFDSIFHAK